MAYDGKITSVALKREDYDDLIVSVGSFITMQPSYRGPYAMEPARQADIRYHWKARVLDLLQRRSGLKIQVEHMWSPSEMHKQPISKRRNFPRLQANWLCLSDHQDIVEADSITNVFQAFHFDIGSLLFEGEKPTALRDSSIWFYKHMYLTSVQKIYEISFPKFADLDVAHVDVSTIMLAKRKLCADIQTALRERGGICSHVKMNLDIGMFIVLFKTCTTIKKTSKMFTTTEVPEEFLSSLIPNKWWVKLHDQGADTIECRLDPKSIRFRYCIRKQTLYVTFKFRRWRHVFEDRKWKVVCQEQDDNDGTHSKVVELKLLKERQFYKLINVECEWSLFDIRRILEVEGDLNHFKFCINDDMIGRRREEMVQAKSCLPPNTISISEM